jgi:DNA-directed RNA polymerase specialized sigma24 family protein
MTQTDRASRPVDPPAREITSPITVKPPDLEDFMIRDPGRADTAKEASSVTAITADELQTANLAFRGATELAETARLARQKLVLQALAEGWTHAAIAEALGVSRGLISQFVAAARTSA